MTLQSPSRILDILAEETRSLSALAERLDRLVPEILAMRPRGREIDLHDLQHIDAARQYLADISRVLSALSRQMQDAADVDMNPLVETATLDDFKRRLLDKKPTHAQSPEPGHAQLF